MKDTALGKESNRKNKRSWLWNEVGNMEISPVACASALGLAVILRQRNRTAHKSRRSRKRRTRGGAASKHDRKLRSRFVHPRDNDAPGFTRSGNLYFNSHEAENRQRRRIECADIFAWLQAHPQLPAGTSVVVSLPDLSELDPVELSVTQPAEHIGHEQQRTTEVERGR